MTPEEAFKKALKDGPSDETRRIASQKPDYALRYARQIDKGEMREECTKRASIRLTLRI